MPHRLIADNALGELHYAKCKLKEAMKLLSIDDKAKWHIYNALEDLNLVNARLNELRKLESNEVLDRPRSRVTSEDN